MAKHFIRIDGNYFITHTFSDDFPEHVEQLLPTDICIKEDGGRHFNLELYREDGLSRYKYVAGEIVETTDEDLSDQLQRIKLEKEMYQLKYLYQERRLPMIWLTRSGSPTTLSGRALGILM